MSAQSQTPGSPQNLDQRRQALESLTAQEDALERKLGADRNALSRLLGALALFSRDPPPPLLVSPADAKDAVRAMILAKAIAPQLEARARVLSQEAAALGRLRREAARASGELFAAESALADRQGRLEAVADDAGLIAPPQVRAAAAAQDALPAPTRLMAPTDATISVRYGGRLASGLIARGLAFEAAPGAPVRSPAKAMVAYAGPLNGWGEVVILRAGGGCHMVLSGLGKVSVNVGQSVAAATPIGAMPIGGQLNPELYLEVRCAAGPVDPAKLMSVPDLSGKAGGASVNTAKLRLRRQGVH
ncbi:MAG TPA: peptidoglycan DD-metalloendopeptidase family protein [Caulobacteraceae bacterium]|jgi:septal ring factor EnvC (AmiA/AmiB activator)|nr:peptidoglycan DD-metalloendopeptidase family protein [Caulobacteraceae bacterium]